MRKILIDDAIRAIYPDAQFTTVDGVITEWKGPGVVPSDEELNAKLIELKANEPFKLLREERNRRLAECDWIVTKNAEYGYNISKEWRTYRQALRDLPSITYKPELTEFGSLKMDSVAWPTPPE
tara:strand:+ start:4711 stop:5082 length:372 start_codon:yes stop_codon:yes gene_type:complete